MFVVDLIIGLAATTERERKKRKMQKKGEFSWIINNSNISFQGQMKKAYLTQPRHFPPGQQQQ
jgi:hypothetical protein